MIYLTLIVATSYQCDKSYCKMIVRYLVNRAPAGDSRKSRQKW